MNRARILASFVVSTLLVASLALADIPPEDIPPQEPESRETSFQAVTGADQEAVPGGNLLIGAYALLWLFVGLYVARMGLEQRKVETRIAGVEKRVAGLERPGA
jgi:hypothetical protein